MTKDLMAQLITGEGSLPLVVIVGETGSGKSALAMQIARENNGEIICADSRTVYKGMDIGTAKPSRADREAVPHHCLDLVRPDQSFTAADFKQCAAAAIDDISARGKLPIMVGGTGLYIDAVIYDFQFRPAADPTLRQQLSELGVEELQQKLRERSIPLPRNDRNPRHLIRALETNGRIAEKRPLRQNTLTFGLSVPREELAARISKRVEAMIAAGLEQEAKRLAETFGWDAPGLQTIGYKEWQPYFAGTQSLQATRELIIKNSLQYAKRQRTWFKRNNSIQWIDNRDK